jgi:hypothetical protein
MQDEKDTYLPRLNLNFSPSLALRPLSSHSIHSTPARVVNPHPQTFQPLGMPETPIVQLHAPQLARGHPPSPTCADAALNWLTSSCVLAGRRHGAHAGLLRSLLGHADSEVKLFAPRGIHVFYVLTSCSVLIFCLSYGAQQPGGFRAALRKYSHSLDSALTPRRRFFGACWK